MPENNHILNKVCKAMLKVVGLKPRADTLYSLQVGEWGWEEGGLREANPKDRVPIFIVPYLLRQPPGKVMEFLFYAPGEEYCDLLKYMEQMEPGPFPPINLAIMILSQIHDRLLTEIGYYPCKRPTQGSRGTLPSKPGGRSKVSRPFFLRIPAFAPIRPCIRPAKTLVYQPFSPQSRVSPVEVGSMAFSVATAGEEAFH